MTSHHDNDQPSPTGPGADDFDAFVLPDDIAALLADESTWAPVDDDLETSVVAAIMAEVETSGRAAASPDPASAAIPQPATAQPAPDRAAHDAAATSGSNVVAMPSRWRSAALGAAAALLVVAGLFGVTRLGGSGADLEVALAGTELAPDASAVAEITETIDGTRIVVSVDGLAPAPVGTYYEAWLRKDAEVGVSAGTFHLRGGGDQDIELWAGVSTDEYPLFTITLQSEAQTESSGQVVLRVLIGDS